MSNSTTIPNSDLTLLTLSDGSTVIIPADTEKSRNTLRVLEDDSVEVVPPSVRWDAASEIDYSRSAIQQLRAELAKEAKALEAALEEIERLRRNLKEQAATEILWSMLKEQA